MQVDQDNLRHKHEELINAYRDKNRKLLQTTELYDKLKRRIMLGQVQNAASDAVDHTIQASIAANRFVDGLGNQDPRSQHAPILSTRQDHIGLQSRTNSALSGIGMAPPNGRGGNGDAWPERYASQNSHRCKLFASPGGLIVY